MIFKIQIELDEEDIMQELRKEVFKFLESNMIPKRATIKTFENQKPILNKIEIKKK